ncbi:hypothetical protein CFC21_081753 [Triticum aestivum]|uniref:WAT1-related protein n=2 Tax=Triticum aestivum TaxID=4565 RepID=A0A9R1L4J7_WHEAT|nr:WAT1-related protein At3g30340-like [Triticum aestivum]KAF7077169.1 hypothetical protein CFC21_081753 [Triticum aestivum]
MDWKPAVMMMAVVIMYAVLNVMTKIAFNEGMHTTVFIVLRLLIAALFLSPVAYFRERKSRPKLTIEIFVYLFLSALLGVDLIGAPAKHLATTAAHSGAPRWVVGLVALLGFSTSWPMWFILQSKIGTKYPALYSSTAWMFLLSFAQMAVVGAATEKMTLQVWVPGTVLQAVTVLFAGVGVLALGLLAMTWCVERRGPVFTTAFMPLIQIITAGIDVAILHEQLHLGSVGKEQRGKHHIRLLH